jgi:hypothetical protein
MFQHPSTEASADCFPASGELGSRNLVVERQTCKIIANKATNVQGRAYEPIDMFHNEVALIN